MNTLHAILLLLICSCKVAPQPISETRTASPRNGSEFDAFKNSFKKADFSTCSQVHGKLISNQLCILDPMLNDNENLEILTVLALYGDKWQETQPCHKDAEETCEMSLGEIAEKFQSDSRALIVYNQVKSEASQKSASSLSLISSPDQINQRIICKSSFFGEVQLKEVLCKLTEGKEEAKQTCGSICSIDSSGNPLNCLCALRINPTMRRFVNATEEECRSMGTLPGGITFKWYSADNSILKAAGSRCHTNGSRCWGCFME